MADHLDRGRRAEALAAEHLCQQGLELVAANFRARVGELDLVMIHDRVLVVVEVRSRARSSFVSPAGSVTWPKQRRIIRTTQFFVMRHRQFAHWPVRFDVVEVTGGLSQPALNWIRSAFDCNDMAAG